MAESKTKPDGVTVEAVRKQYPEQCSEIAAAARAALLAEIEAMDVHEVQGTFPTLVKKLQVPIVKGMDPSSGFILALTDPFGEGAARDYAKARGCQVSSLPAILPWGDAATIVALKMYVIRAKGSGDAKRAEAALAAVKKYSSPDAAKILGK